MNEDRATRYHRLRRWVGVASLATTAAVFLGLLTTGGAPRLRDLSAALVAAVGLSGAARSWAIPAIYALAVAAFQEVVTFPFALYRGWHLERRFGLSREALGAWLRDHLKGIGVGWALGLIAVEYVYFTLRGWPSAWWLMAAAGFALATVLLANLAPIVLLPIFYRFRPLERHALRTRLMQLAERAGTRVVGVYEWALSDKTRKANAALVGLGRTRRILLSDTLLAEYSDEEIEVVLAHELAHHVHGDIRRGMLFEIALTFAGFYCADAALRIVGPRVGVQAPDDVAGLPLLMLAGGTLSLLLVPLANAVSRRHERRADRFAIELTRNVEAFVSAMRRLGAQNLSEERPSRLVEVLFYTHPPLNQRIAAARAARAAAGSG